MNQEKPRVLIFSLAAPPLIGGAEVAVKEITDRLPEFQFEIINADVRNFWSKYLFPFWAYWRACRWQRQKKFNLVWAMMANQAGMAASLFKRKFPEMPFLLTLQEGDDLSSWSYRFRLLGPRLFRVFQRADRIQAISNYLAEWAKKMGATGSIEVIPNGVNLKSFEFRIPKLKENPVIVTTSRLVPKNGVGNLIEALNYLPENVKLLIVGDGPLKLELMLKTKNHKLETRVEFAGAVPPERISDYLARADIFARPSLSEGMGNSFIEAMAAGVPVIGTPVGGIVDFLRAGETGWLCRVQDPVSLAEQIKQILAPENQTQVAEITTRAKKLVEEKYDWDHVALKMKILFNQLIA